MNDARSDSTLCADPACAGALMIEGVTKLFGDFRAVDNISLDVAPGEFITLLGPSGSGKTTTLRMVAGFIDPDAGKVVLDGEDLTCVPAHKRNLGMVFQNYALFPHMTASENIAFPLSMRRQSKPVIKDRVEEALRLVHLEGLGDRYPRQLSGGQQQRVALARALSFHPRVLLMDEPLGALDKKLREVLQLEIMRISRQLDVTVIYVTHDQEEALVMSDRIAIYNSGRIEQLGTSEDLYERPTSVFVADFVGQSNIFRGTFRENGHAEIVTDEGESIRVPGGAGRRAGLSSGDQGAVVLRPERMWIRADAGASDDHQIGSQGEVVQLRGRLREVIYLGSDLKFVVESGRGNTVAVRVASGQTNTTLPTDGSVVIGWAVDDSVVVPDPDRVGVPSAPRSTASGKH